LEFLSQDKNIQVILVNILSSVPTASEVAEVIAKFVQKHEERNTSKTRAHHHHQHIVIRLAGLDLDSAKDQLAQVQVPLVENLDEAVAEAVRLTKPSATKK
jgi:succinyl-CoA synthetase beta subunit